MALYHRLRDRRAHRHYLRGPLPPPPRRCVGWSTILARLARLRPVIEIEITRMQDIKSPRILWLKGFLFLLIGLTSAVLLFLEVPALRTVVLLLLAIWGFCRAYYFAF